MFPEQIHEDSRMINLNGKKRIVMMAYCRSHYALLEFCLKKKKIRVTDGLFKSVSFWKPHVMACLRQHNLIEPNSRMNLVLDSYDPDSPFEYPTPASSTHVKWKFCRSSVVQTDGDSCGVIVCMQAWKVFSSGRCPSLDAPINESRAAIINHCNATMFTE